VATKVIEAKKAGPGGGNTVVVAVDGSKGSLDAFYYALKNTSEKDQIKIFHGEHAEVQLAGDGLYKAGDVPPETLKKQEALIALLQSECKDNNVSPPLLWPAVP